MCLGDENTPTSANLLLAVCTILCVGLVFSMCLPCMTWGATSKTSAEEVRNLFYTVQMLLAY